MRNLSCLDNQFVLCKGWIDRWWDQDNGQIRYLIKNPTIKKPDKNILFENLPISYKEDHINLFIFKDQEDILCSIGDAIVERHQKVYFSGIIEPYIRKDGSTDYGIHPTKSFNLGYELKNLYEELDWFHENKLTDSDFKTLMKFWL